MKRAKKIVWGAAGFVSLGVGVVGIVVPGLPTTVFLLITAYCFTRSSERLHRWLMEHPQFGQPIRDWNEHGAIPMRGKILAAVMMVVAVVITIWLHAPTFVVIGQIIILAMVSVFFWTRPNGPASGPTVDPPA